MDKLADAARCPPTFERTILDKFNNNCNINVKRETVLGKPETLNANVEFILLI